MRWILQDVASDLLPKERVRWCLHWAIPGKLREIWRTTKTGRAHYKNLIVCGSIWHCPICAAKISERRRAELVLAFNSAAGMGLTPIFASFTLRHKKGERLAVVLQALLKSYSRLKSGKAWVGFVERFGLFGDIRALETTHGENGWHPHIHVVLFVRSDDVPAMQEWLQNHWVQALGASGRSAIREFAVNVKVGNQAISAYLNKAGGGWELSDELARGSSKVARAKGRSPFALLRDFAGGSDAQAGVLFREYGDAFKGKVQLRYSKDLKEAFGLKEISDDEIASKPETPSEFLTVIKDYEWDLVEQFRARGNLLEVASKSGWEGVRSFLEVLQARASDPAERAQGDDPKKLRSKKTKVKERDTCLYCGGPVPGGGNVHQSCRDARLEKGGNTPPPVE